MTTTERGTRLPPVPLPEAGRRRGRDGIWIAGVIVLVVAGMAIMAGSIRGGGGPDWLTYEDPSGRFRVDYPRTAEVIERGTGPERSVVFVNGQGSAMTEIALAVTPFAPGAGFDARSAAQGEAYGAADAGGATVITAGEPVTIAGKVAYLNVIAYEGMIQRSVFVDAGDEVMVVSGAAREQALEWEDVFERFADSFVVTGGGEE